MWYEEEGGGQEECSVGAPLFTRCQSMSSRMIASRANSSSSDILSGVWDAGEGIRSSSLLRSMYLFGLSQSHASDRDRKPLRITAIA